MRSVDKEDWYANTAIKCAEVVDEMVMKACCDGADGEL